MTPFHPLVVRSGKLMSGIDKYFLRVLLGVAGRTMFHRSRLVEIADTHGSLRQLCPLAESDLSESAARPFWVPRQQSDRKRFNIERRDKSRRHRVIGVVWGDARPKFARRHNLPSRFPDHGFLHHLVADLGYAPDAARTTAQGWRFNAAMYGRPDRRRKVALGGADYQAERMTFDEDANQRKPAKDFQHMAYGKNLYLPAAPILTDRDFTKTQVDRGLSRMRTKNNAMKQAIAEIVYHLRSPLEVSDRTGIPVELLHVYASRLRAHIRRESLPIAA